MSQPAEQPLEDTNCNLCGQPVAGLPGKNFTYARNVDTGKTFVRHLNGQCPRFVDTTPTTVTLV